MVRPAESLGLSVKEIFGALVPTATAEGIAGALTPIIGRPVVNHYGQYSEIKFTPNQETVLTEWILSQLRKEPGAVRVDAGGVALKVLARQYWPWVLGLAGLSAVLGFSIAYGGRRG